MNNKVTRNLKYEIELENMQFQYLLGFLLVIVGFVIYIQKEKYNESKRAGEAFIKAYELQHKIRTKITRIFNTSGPRIRYGPEFGRVIPNFIHQALNDENITVFGDGSQTRSFTYVVDEIEGFFKILGTDKAIGEVINLGNNKQYTILELAKKIIEITNSNSKITYQPLPIDDPRNRSPILEKANSLLNWRPTTPLEEGLKKTIAWFKDIEQENGV